ncbi:DUF927 domain-containing protein [Gluconacetobacter sp. 1b LMG 1731]|uniref:DUF927 domain-containing protein n=1 Tax=Gluconacetobacter dulcium TaxID=2729096 RepID=A0A7W4IMA2_9PROT|nr:DUF927 domain-containing protein [Gluconacetobacter dulcium]MBB2165379.1 DUF927 domain-containing protein [Gluconacetobacter dulcium]MBB2194454.1 DUF927 domain-containing protein [Gluconacetobacter dulcium]
MSKKPTGTGRKGVRQAVESAEVVAFPSAGANVEQGQSRPPPGVSRRFNRDESGLWRRPTDDGASPLFIAGPIDLLAETRDAEGNGWGLLLGWTDRDGVRHEEAFPRAMFSGEAGELRSRLANGGLTLAASAAAKNAFTEWLALIATEERARSVTRIGWHAFGSGSVYVLPSATFGMADERVVLQQETPEPDLFGVSGTVEEWRNRIGALCRGNSRLVLSASAAFAAPLLTLMGEDGGGFSLMGASRLGKSTALRVAASVCGGTMQAGAEGYVRSWRATGNALESVALAACDGLLCLDELGQLDPREAGDTAYMLSNGAGKARASRTGGARAVTRWKILFLSTGERTLADMNAEAGRATKAGQEVRFVDIPADAGAGSGLFERLHHADAPGDLAEHLRAETGQLYGAPFRAFLTRLTQRLATESEQAVRDALRARVIELTDHYLRNWPQASGQVRSVARRFAIVALGGELATGFGLTGWDDDTASELVKLCFDAWLTARGTAGRREDEQAVEQLRDFLSRNGEGRFERWVDPQATDTPQSGDPSEPPGERFRTQNRAGWKRWQKQDDGRMGWTFYLSSAGMNEALSGLNGREAKRVLVDRGFLVPAADGKMAKVVSPPGFKAVRAYEVRPVILGSDAGDTG